MSLWALVQVEFFGLENTPPLEFLVGKYAEGVR